MSAFGGKADIDQPLPPNLDLWVDALKNPFSHLFLGGAGFWGTGAYTQHEIFAEKIYGLVPRAVGERVAFQDWNRPPRDRKGLLSAREREPARVCRGPGSSSLRARPAGAKRPRGLSVMIFYSGAAETAVLSAIGAAILAGRAAVPHLWVARIAVREPTMGLAQVL